MKLKWKRMLAVLLMAALLANTVAFSFAAFAADGDTLTLQTSGGTLAEPAPDTYTPGMVLPDAGGISCPGYAFAGWYTDADCTEGPVYSVPGGSSGPLTYYARWVVPGTVYEDYEKWTCEDTVTAVASDAGDNITTQPSTELNDNAVSTDHWYFWSGTAGTTLRLNQNAAHVYAGQKSIELVLKHTNGSVSLWGGGTQYANERKGFPVTEGVGVGFWMENSAEVTFSMDFDNWSTGSDTPTDTGNFTVPAGKHYVTVPYTAANAELHGWRTRFKFQHAADEDITLYLDNIGTYSEPSSVEFVTMGGEFVNPAPKSYTRGMPLPDDTDIAREGHLFAGWYKDSAYKEGPVHVVPAEAEGALTYYARWIKRVDDFVTFEDHAADVGEVYTIVEKDGNTTVDHRGTFIQGNEPNTFMFWSAMTGPTAEVTDDPAHVAGGSYAVKLHIPADAGGRKVQFGTQRYSWARPVTGDGMVFWIEAEHETTFDIAFDTAGKPGSTTATFTLPAGRGYLTVPWSDPGAAASEWKWRTDIEIAALADTDNTVYIDSVGTYSDSFYAEGELTFHENGGEWTEGFEKPSTYKTGDALPTYENIRQDGYVFAGWYTDAAFSGDPLYEIGREVSGSLSLYARWVAHDPAYEDYEKWTDTQTVTLVPSEDRKNMVRDHNTELVDDQQGTDHWYLWSGTAGTTLRLNQYAAHVSGGKQSIELMLKGKQSSELVLWDGGTQYFNERKHFPAEQGDGICFWMENDAPVTFHLEFDWQDVRMPDITVPAGRRYIVLPYSSASGAISGGKFTFKFEHADTDATLYLDDIGTYSDVIENELTFQLNGGSYVDGYFPPKGYFTASGIPLPDCDSVENNGLAFAGWYESEDLSGSAVYAVAPETSGAKTYYAKWVVHDVNSDGMNTYDCDADLINANHWAVQGGTGTIALNTNPEHAHNGAKSVRVTAAAANSDVHLYTMRTPLRREGDGIAFWMETPNGAKVQMKFNSTNHASAVKDVPAGKSLVFFPWSELDGAKDDTGIWQVDYFIQVPAAGDVVYFDEVGTYTEDTESASEITYDLRGGGFASGYTAPTRFTTANIDLPAQPYLSRSGFVFAGWYEDAEYAGEPVYVVSDVGEKHYVAKWIAVDPSYDTFESYTGSESTTDTHEFWQTWVEGAETSLNVLAENAGGGSKSLKFTIPNGKDAGSPKTAGVLRDGGGPVSNLQYTGDGIGFWIKSEIAISGLNVRLNYMSSDSPGITASVSYVPKGRSYVTVPWTAFGVEEMPASLWRMEILVKTPTGNLVTNTVYIDDIGTYSANTKQKITYNLGEGASFVDESTVTKEYDPVDGAVLPTFEQVQGTRDGEPLYFAGWYTNENLTGVPVFSIEPGSSSGNTFWAKWVEQTDVNHDFESFADTDAMAGALWQNDTVYEGWTPHGGGCELDLTTDTANLAPGSAKGLHAAWEIFDGPYIAGGTQPRACFRNFTWGTTFGKRGTDKDGDGVRFWIKSDRTVQLTVSFLLSGDPKNGTKMPVLTIPANVGVTVYLPWTALEKDGVLASVGFIVTGQIGDTGNLWLDDLGTYSEEKIVTYVRDNEDGDVRITAYNNYVTKDIQADFVKHTAAEFAAAGGVLPDGSSLAYYVDYTLTDPKTEGLAKIGGPIWISFKIPAGADRSKIGAYTMLIGGLLEPVNYVINGDWLVIYRPDTTAYGTMVITLNDTQWQPKGPTVDGSGVQQLTETTTTTKPGDPGNGGNAAPAEPNGNTGGTANNGNAGTTGGGTAGAEDPGYGYEDPGYDYGDSDYGYEDPGYEEDPGIEVDPGDSGDSEEPETDDTPKRGPLRRPLNTATPETPAEEETGGGLPWWAIVLIGVGAAAVIAAAVLVPILLKRRNAKESGGEQS